MTMNPKRVLFAALVSALLFSPSVLMALRAQESVADAARKAQAEKKSTVKAATVFTNDNIDTVKGTINVVGEAPAPPEDKTTTAQDKTKTPPTEEKTKAAAPDDKSKAAPADDKTTSTKDEAYWRKTFADARKKLADDAHELDILQREYNLKQQQYYSDPNTAMKEQFSRQDLTDTKTKIDDKTAAVAQDKQAISDLEDALRQAGGQPGWAAAP
jgi:hypothetical protein